LAAITISPDGFAVFVKAIDEKVAGEGGRKKRINESQQGESDKEKACKDVWR